MKSVAWMSCWAAIILVALSKPGAATAREGAFVHPGLLQTQAELDYMRDKVLAKNEPWKSAYDNLRAQPFSSIDFQPRAIAHIIRGPYGNPSAGDRDLMASANAAYSQALQWFITRDPAHARKAGQILDAWAAVLADFQGNDAKLLAGWTGHNFCNAAEILRHTGATWNDAAFRQMLLTVYYPLIAEFFPDANGNWDAAIMDTMECIGVYCDDHQIFDRATEHFMRGTGNGGIARYIYPTGQCEESARDQGHTQLGLGELVQACQVAWNQGVDLYGAADHRLALGIEYTAQYMLGEDVPATCALCDMGRGKFSDIYEAAWQHYHYDCGMKMPFVGRVVEQTRTNRWWDALTMYRGPWDGEHAKLIDPVPSPIAAAAGALDEPSVPAPAQAIKVAAEESIQVTLDKAKPGDWIELSRGIYMINATLRVPSGVTLSGHGKSTTIYVSQTVAMDTNSPAIANAADNAGQIVLRDFVLDGGAPPPAVRPLHPDPNASRRARARATGNGRAGMAFRSAHGGKLSGLRLEHITVRSWTRSGVDVDGAAHVVIEACDFSDNGARVAPGAGAHHDLLLDGVEDAEIRDCRLDDSLYGNGLWIKSGRNIRVNNNELARNTRCGLQAFNVTNLQARGNLAEANDLDGLSIYTTSTGEAGAEIAKNLCRNNGLAGIRICGPNVGEIDNAAADNGAEKQIVTAQPAAPK